MSITSNNSNKNIIYIGSNDIAVLSQDGSNFRLIKNFNSNDLNIQEFKKLLPLLNHTYIILNSPHEISENKSFPIGTKECIIKSFIDRKTRGHDVLIGNGIKLFHKSLEYQNVAITTAIPKNDNTAYIKNIINAILESKMSIIGFFSLNQTILSLSKIDKNKINIAAIVSKSFFIFSISYGYKFIFGRTIKVDSNNQELTKLVHALGKNISIIVKYISTALSFLQKNVLVNIINFTEEDISDIKTFNDPVFETIELKFYDLQYPEIENLQINDIKIIEELSLVLFLVKNNPRKYIPIITNKDIVLRKNKFFFNQGLKITIILTFIANILVFLNILKINISKRTEVAKYNKKYKTTYQQNTEIKKMITNVKDTIYPKVNSMIFDFIYKTNKEYETMMIDLRSWLISNENNVLVEAININYSDGYMIKINALFFVPQGINNIDRNNIQNNLTDTFKSKFNSYKKSDLKITYQDNKKEDDKKDGKKNNTKDEKNTNTPNNAVLAELNIFIKAS